MNSTLMFYYRGLSFNSQADSKHVLSCITFLSIWKNMFLGRSISGWKLIKENVYPKQPVIFSFSTEEVRYFDGFGSLIDAKRLHTFFPIPRSGITIFHKFPRKFKISIHDFFSKFMFLHFLSLYCCLELREVRDSVGDLEHLHSLDLSGTSIRKTT